MVESREKTFNGLTGSYFWKAFVIYFIAYSTLDVLPRNIKISILF